MAIWVSAALLFVMIIMVVISLALSGDGKSKSVTLDNHSILHIDLSGQIAERPAPVGLIDRINDLEEPKAKLALNQVVNSILAAADDASIEGIFLECSGAQAGIASRCEIADALETFRLSGKWVLSYGDYYSQGDYLVASAADTVYVNPEGLVEVAGLSSTVMFYKNLLDKAGVDVQVIKVGTYKSAVEPYILDEMSEANREQTKGYVDGIWNTLAEMIGRNRGVSALDVNRWADSLSVTWPVEKLLAEKVVDRSLYRHEFDELLAELTGRDDVDDLRFITPAEYAEVRNIYKADDDKKRIAVLYAVGDIVDTGKEGISAEAMVPEILALAEDDDVAGLVLRVNSGGGSAFASEQIWEALEQFKATGRPFYVSMGDVAASGGYYISCAADRIYASKQTLTGSIGIFGLIPCVKRLLNDKIGVTTSTVGSNAHPGFMNLTTPLSPVEREALQRRINRGYETFTRRCADGRNMDIDSIKAIAEGRVWDGVMAKRIGLVDRFGTLVDAVTDMAEELKLKKYSVGIYPEYTPTIWQMVMSAQADMESAALERELGEAYEAYRTVRRIGELEPVQCRMESVELK